MTRQYLYSFVAQVIEWVDQNVTRLVVQTPALPCPWTTHWTLNSCKKEISLRTKEKHASHFSSLWRIFFFLMRINLVLFVSHHSNSEGAPNWTLTKNAVVIQTTILLVFYSLSFGLLVVVTYITAWMLWLKQQRKKRQVPNASVFEKCTSVSQNKLVSLLICTYTYTQTYSDNHIFTFSDFILILSLLPLFMLLLLRYMFLQLFVSVSILFFVC